MKYTNIINTEYPNRYLTQNDTAYIKISLLHTPKKNF